MNGARRFDRRIVFRRGCAEFGSAPMHLQALIPMPSDVAGVDRDMLRGMQGLAASGSGAVEVAARSARRRSPNLPRAPRRPDAGTRCCACGAWPWASFFRKPGWGRSFLSPDCPTQRARSSVNVLTQAARLTPRRGPSKITNGFAAARKFYADLRSASRPAEGAPSALDFPLPYLPGTKRDVSNYRRGIENKPRGCRPWQ